MRKPVTWVRLHGVDQVGKERSSLIGVVLLDDHLDIDIVGC